MNKPKTLTIEGFAYCKPSEPYEHGSRNSVDGFTYRYSAHDVKDYGSGYIDAGRATMTIQLPEGFDPRQGAVTALEHQKKAIMAEFQKRMTEIDQQISRFTAIDYVEAE